ncbi:hypothetical protein Hanom_Chr11g01041031 [Helianthus anomalus]
MHSWSLLSIPSAANIQTPFYISRLHVYMAVQLANQAKKKIISFAITIRNPSSIPKSLQNNLAQRKYMKPI